MLQVKASKKVNFQDIVKLEILSDDEQIVLVSLRSRTMRLAVKDSVAFVCAIQRNMKVHTFLPENKAMELFGNMSTEEEGLHIHLRIPALRFVYVVKAI